jgi:hypothetical protein
MDVDLKTDKALREFKPGVYKHFKGHHKLALFLASDCENPKQKFVIYTSLYDDDRSQKWVRPVENFLGYKKLKDRTKIKRFVFERDY